MPFVAKRKKGKKRRKRKPKAKPKAKPPLPHEMPEILKQMTDSRKHWITLKNAYFPTSNLDYLHCFEASCTMMDLKAFLERRIFRNAQNIQIFGEFEREPRVIEGKQGYADKTRLGELEGRILEKGCLYYNVFPIPSILEVRL